MVRARCPVCSEMLNIDLPLDIGSSLRCASCMNLLEVVWLYPVELDIAEIQSPGLEYIGNGPAPQGGG